MDFTQKKIPKKTIIIPRKFLDKKKIYKIHIHIYIKKKNVFFHSTEFLVQVYLHIFKVCMNVRTRTWTPSNLNYIKRSKAKKE